MSHAQHILTQTSKSDAHTRQRAAKEFAQHMDLIGYVEHVVNEYEKANRHDRNPTVSDVIDFEVERFTTSEQPPVDIGIIVRTFIKPLQINPDTCRATEMYTASHTYKSRMEDEHNLIA